MSIATALILALRPPQPLPEGLQRVSPLAVADEDHRTAFKVQDDRQVAMALGDGDFVDGDLAEVLELGLGVAAGRSRFWMSLTTSQLTPRWRATSRMVIRRDNSRA